MLYTAILPTTTRPGLQRDHHGLTFSGAVITSEAMNGRIMVFSKFRSRGLDRTMPLKCQSGSWHASRGGNTLDHHAHRAIGPAQWKRSHISKAIEIARIRQDRTAVVDLDEKMLVPVTPSRKAEN